MVTTLDLQRRGLRYGVIVDAAATPATLAGIERAGLRYKVEVASGITAADRAALDRRGLQYFVPVSATVSMADRAILERQGLRYAVQVDATILPADLAALERQGLSYFVEVDSSGNAIATAAGGGLLLVDETNGFATDFTHAVDAERVALKTAGATTYSTVDGFYANAGTSPKMVYDVAGVLGWSPHNTCLQSQTFDTGWAHNAFTVTANAVAAPDGTTTADAFIPPAGAVSPYTSQAIAVPNGTVVTFSVYAKNGVLTPWFLIQSDAAAYFNLSTGVKGSTTGISNNMVAVGNGWYRCDMTFTAASATPIVYLAMTTADGLSANCNTGDGVKIGIYLWGAQMNRGSVPLAYLPTTTAARFGLALNYDPVTHAPKGLLCEPAATNVLTYSNDLSTGSTPAGGTITLDNQTGPDGALTADTFTENTATDSHGFYGNIGIWTIGNDATLSRFIKMGTRRYASLAWADGTNGAYAVFDLQSGVVGSSATFGTGTAPTASIQALPNGWYRCAITTKATNATMYVTAQAATAATITVDGFGRQSFLGTGSTLFFAHGQLEAGTVATSPIPTLGATVTRAADSVYVAPASINYSTTAGSWRVEATLNTFIANARIIGLQTGTAPIFENSATNVGCWDGPSFFGKAVTSILGSHKVACALQDGSRAITADGLAVATDAAAGALSSAGTRIGFGTNPTVVLGGDWINGYIRKVVYVPRRKTNAELVTETT